ncbi:WG repeat protein [Tenacibaculum skagerrakense]|uniref:WG repeat protein n=1 Tax=Tenacibaculum skagerrakense TaxID=186571 RepID=A0A4R2NTJ4_9FLAO|nr:WG repeat-containing protein [Tenacibaculum skagerrakense]TCP25162.1 WG repeat protein [Tenacibaculum skagerrakense]
MKRLITFTVILLLIPTISLSQTSESFDYVSSFHEGYAAVKKDNQWSFIDTNGNLVMNFRNDLVVSENPNGNQPILSNNRCLIVKKENGISFFGFINEKGNVVIKPQYLNASNFNNSFAIVLKLQKEVAGHNNLFKKDIVYYTYTEIIIDTSEKTIKKLSKEPVNVVLRKDFLPAPPKISSKLISKNLVAVLTKNQKWVIKKTSLDQ